MSDIAHLENLWKEEHARCVAEIPKSLQKKTKFSKVSQKKMKFSEVCSTLTKRNLNGADFLDLTCMYI